MDTFVIAKLLMTSAESVTAVIEMIHSRSLFIVFTLCSVLGFGKRKVTKRRRIRRFFGDEGREAGRQGCARSHAHARAKPN